MCKCPKCKGTAQFGVIEDKVIRTGKIITVQELCVCECGYTFWHNVEMLYRNHKLIKETYSKAEL